MVGKRRPLDNNVQIVDQNGRPTNYFIRWAQENGLDVQSAISEQEVEELIDDAFAAHSIVAGTALDGGGSLSAPVVTIDHSDQPLVTPGVYGSATKAPVITVDQQGHVTDISEVAIAGGGGGSGGSSSSWLSATGDLDDISTPVVTVTGSYSGNPQNSLRYEPINDFFWNDGETAGVVKFDFGVPVLLTGIGFIQDGDVDDQGTWQVAGSNDDVTYTDLGTPGIWGGSLLSSIVFTNTTDYQYYRLTQASGVTNNDPYQSMFIFRWGSSGGGGGSGSPAAVIQTAYNRGNVGSLTATFASPVTAGSLIIAISTGGGSPGLFNLQDWEYIYRGTPTSNQYCTIVIKVADGTETGATVSTTDMTNLAVYETDGDRINILNVGKLQDYSGGWNMHLVKAQWGDSLNIVACEHDNNNAFALTTTGMSNVQIFTSGNHNGLNFTNVAYFGKIEGTLTGGSADPMVAVVQVGKNSPI